MFRHCASVILFKLYYLSFVGVRSDERIALAVARWSVFIGRRIKSGVLNE